MIREIRTNLGTFGNFKDLEICMRLEHHASVVIFNVILWDFYSLKALTGTYTYLEILQTVREVISA